ncbi:MAG: hypothetical protein IPK15_11140 [Verrucomicrobia bacterium]|nr:hypothetical protein [Verrucomicrobiota bacterium]
MFEPHAGTRKVTIFGSARTAPSKQEYQQAVDFARKIADAGWMVITGAGPGIMQAGHEGAGPERSFGANIRLPWEQWDKHVREHLLRNGLISPEDLNLYHITDDPEHAVKFITRFYRNYHSMRFVRDRLVIRLQHTPSQASIDALNEDFADLIVGEKVKVCEATPEEREDNQFVNLPRISFEFNKRDYGKLRGMIDVLNGF